MIFLLMAAAVASVDARCASRVDFYQPPQGIVSTPEAAARVAEIYLTPIYGAPLIQEELPLKARLERGVWVIKGKDLPQGFFGGVAEIHICRSNGRVLRVIHGK